MLLGIFQRLKVWEPGFCIAAIIGRKLLLREEFIQQNAHDSPIPQKPVKIDLVKGIVDRMPPVHAGTRSIRVFSFFFRLITGIDVIWDLCAPERLVRSPPDTPKHHFRRRIYLPHLLFQPFLALKPRCPDRKRMVCSF